jgi:flagellin-like hook-associated protein FlgL
MAVNGIGSNAALVAQSLVDMRGQLNDLQRQLGTGQKSASYAGVGVDRGLTVGLRAQLSAISGFQNTITTVDTTLQVAQTSLGQIGDIGHNVKSALQLGTYALDNTGQTTAQETAYNQLGQVLDLLNTQVAGRQLFSGKALDQPATDTLSRILDGDATHAGFKQVMAERNQADMGADGLGRLLIPVPIGNVASISEDVAGSPFGFKLAAVNSTLTNAVVTGPGGVPPAITVDFSAGAPNPGDKIKFSFNLPDGTSEDLTLTATTSLTPAPGEFTIGANAAATAANFQAALAGSVGTLAATALSAASAVAAGTDFFDIDAANPPLRVAGPPFATATALVAGTPANTISWYTGDAGSDPARTTAVARVDTALTASYGMRANEQALRTVVQATAIFASSTFSPTNANDSARYRALADRLGGALGTNPGQQQISDISGDLATAQATLGTAKDRHKQTSAVLTDLVDSIEGVSTEDVGAQILALNTQLQASLQTTAMLFHTSLVNYL